MGQIEGAADCPLVYRTERGQKRKAGKKMCLSPSSRRILSRGMREADGANMVYFRLFLKIMRNRWKFVYGYASEHGALLVIPRSRPGGP